jgi:hypothetical protein
LTVGVVKDNEITEISASSGQDIEEQEKMNLVESEHQNLTMEDIDRQIADAPLSYEESKKQFVELTNKLGLKHTFSFDEAWEVSKEIRRRNEYRDKVLEFQGVIENNSACQSQEEMIARNPLRHSFADGMYIREVVNEPNQIIATKIHKQKHPYFLMEGEMSVLTDEGVKRIKAPHYGITEAGTKRIIYTHTECKFVTVQRTDKTDLEEIEDEVIAKDFNDPVLTAQDIELLMEGGR